MVKVVRDPGFGPNDDELPDVEPRKRPLRERRVGAALSAAKGRPLRKNVSSTFTLDDWRLLDLEALRRKTSMSELIQQELEPFLKKLRAAEVERRKAA